MSIERNYNNCDKCSSEFTDGKVYEILVYSPEFSYSFDNPSEPNDYYLCPACYSHIFEGKEKESTA